MAEETMVERVKAALARQCDELSEPTAGQLARVAIEAVWSQIMEIYQTAQSEYSGDWEAIHEDFSRKVRALFDAALKE